MYPSATICILVQDLYPINGSVIPTTSEHKDLGIIFNSNLSFSSHISLILSKAYKVLGLIRRSFSISNVGVRRALYLSLVRCHLSYCSQIWRSRSQIIAEKSNQMFLFLITSLVYELFLSLSGSSLKTFF